MKMCPEKLLIKPIVIFFVREIEMATTFIIDLESEKEQGVRLSEIKEEEKKSYCPDNKVCRIFALSGRCRKRECLYAHSSGQLNSGQKRIFNLLVDKHRSDYKHNMEANKEIEARHERELQFLIFFMKHDHPYFLSQCVQAQEDCPVDQELDVAIDMIKKMHMSQEKDYEMDLTTVFPDTSSF